ncbi:hypothetical protein D3C87_1230190 [compost metagenome]
MRLAHLAGLDAGDEHAAEAVALRRLHERVHEVFDRQNVRSRIPDGIVRTVLLHGLGVCIARPDVRQLVVRRVGRLSAGGLLVPQLGV